MPIGIKTRAASFRTRPRPAIGGNTRKAAGVVSSITPGCRGCHSAGVPLRQAKPAVALKPALAPLRPKTELENPFAIRGHGAVGNAPARLAVPNVKPGSSQEIDPSWMGPLGPDIHGRRSILQIRIGLVEAPRPKVLCIPVLVEVAYMKPARLLRTPTVRRSFA
jgi:hypothetical protein